MSRYFVTMPQLGESVAEGTISRWLVSPGQAIDELDAMVEINTDKVDAEVPAPVTGVLAEILAPEGAVVPIGGNIAVIEVSETPHPDVATGAEPRAVESDEDAPLTPARRRIADNMSLSKTTIPHAWQAQEVDMSGVAKSIAANRGAVRRQHNASLTYLPYVIAGVAASLRSHPIVNSTFAVDRIVIHHEINIGIAVGLREGVIVPVIRGADRISVAGLAAAVTDLTTRARDAKLTTNDLAGATLTVNNSGALGTLLSYSVIPPGQSAIVTMGAVVERPVAVDGQPVVRPMMYLCLSLDHRVMDGLEASAFLGGCRQWLEAVSVSTAL